MKQIILFLLMFWLMLTAFAQDKVRVFIQGQGTVNATTHSGGARDNGIFGHRSDSTIDSHDESIELAKDMRSQCPEITITLKEEAADYVVRLNRESKAKRGWLNRNTQVMVANKQGDVIWTKDVRQVSSAAKDACAAIIATARPTKTAAEGSMAEKYWGIKPQSPQAPPPK